MQGHQRDSRSTTHVAGEQTGGLDRRQLLTALSAVPAGIALPGLGMALGPLPGTTGGVTKPPKARAVIQIFLSGGLSHLDTFDPKPDAPVEVRGSFRAIPTKLPGERFSELVPRLAGLADQLVVVRSMAHTEAAHERGRHTMLTGYQPSPAIAYPSQGAVVCHELGSQHHLPAYVCVPNASDEFLGTGYLSSAYAPFSVGGEPNRRNFRVRDLNLPGEVDEKRLQRRRDLLAQMNAEFAGRVNADAIDAHDAFSEQAYDLITSKKAKEAFRLRSVPEKVRRRFGRTNIGQRVLLARRLVKAGVRWVTVLDGGYDNHRDIARALPGRIRSVDLAVSALIRELRASGELDHTLVMLTTEFGRTPRINSDRGRDHWPRAFSTVLAGGGLKRGLIHGGTDADGGRPDSDPVHPADLAATVFSLLGIDPAKKLLSPGGRPIDIVRDGKILRSLLA